jgi:hypothetical protein
MLNDALGHIDKKGLEEFCYPPKAADWEKVELIACGKLSQKAKLSMSSWRTLKKDGSRGKAPYSLYNECI